MRQSAKSISEKHKKFDGYYWKKPYGAIDNFYDQTEKAWNLLILVEKNAENNELKTEARKNWVINTVTCMEVYLRELIKEDYGFDFGNTEELLKDTVTLDEAHMLFAEQDLTKIDIIAIHHSFMNIENINKVLTSLTGTPFLSRVGELEFELTEKGDIEFFSKKKLNLEGDFEGWQATMKELFGLRHDYVHQVNVNKDRDGASLEPALCVKGVRIRHKLVPMENAPQVAQ